MKANEKEKSADKAANSRAVLVVDDLEGIRSLLEEFLAPEGYAVLSARNGQEAIKIAEAVSISLLLSDVQMPGIDGVELANHLKSLYPEMGVILMSGHRGEVLTTEKVDKLQAILLWKPFTKKELLSAMRSALRR